MNEPLIKEKYAALVKANAELQKKVGEMINKRTQINFFNKQKNVNLAQLKGFEDEYKTLVSKKNDLIKNVEHALKEFKLALTIDATDAQLKKYYESYNIRKIEENFEKLSKAT